MIGIPWNRWIKPPNRTLTSEEWRKLYDEADRISEKLVSELRRREEPISQRDSGYERKERDLYETPEWVTEALLWHLPSGRCSPTWEPACGSGKMVNVLKERGGLDVYASDIDLGSDFLEAKLSTNARAIITNPPYEQATEFCEHALRLMEPVHGFVAMLLRTDFDHAKGRSHLFRDCPAFAKKIVLMKRICWFVEANGKPKASPSFNHAWYLWDWKHEGPPTIGYGP